VVPSCAWSADQAPHLRGVDRLGELAERDRFLPGHARPAKINSSTARVAVWASAFVEEALFAFWALVEDRTRSVLGRVLLAGSLVAAEQDDTGAGQGPVRAGCCRPWSDIDRQW
jgi:hypothetical protein